MSVRIEKLSGDKVKVTLSATDLVNLDVDIENLTPNSDELHSFLFHIMETVRAETGFNPYNGQVVVEATPSKDGISLVVSKIKPVLRQITKEEIKRGVNIKARIKRTSDKAIFYFEQFDDLCAAICELTENELLKGSLYKLGDTFCYVTDNDKGLSRCVSVLTEFSVKRSAYPLQLTYIKEHGTLIAEGDGLVNMVEKLKSLT